MKMRLHTVICSTRPGRVGPTIAAWFHGIAAADANFDAHLVDLAAFNLPVYDEPMHPMKQDYRHEHTRKWSASVAAADAFVFVTPEYNFGPPPSFVNALTYLFREWHYKPAAFVSYGGMSGGIRSVQQEKLMLTSLRVMPITENVAIPGVAQLLKDGDFTASEGHAKAATAMLKELHHWATALRTMRP